MKNINTLIEAGFNVSKSINDLGGQEVYDEILEDFYNISLTRYKEIVAAKNNNDLKNYAILVHAMKSECMYLGIDYLANLSLNHQLKSESNDIEYINNHINELLNELNRVLIVIKNYLGK